MKTIETLIMELADYVLYHEICRERDVSCCINRLLFFLHVEEIFLPEPMHAVRKLGEQNKERREIEDILEELRAWAITSGRLDDPTQGQRDDFDADVMSCFMPDPSALEAAFFARLAISPKDATDFYYSIARKSNYIREQRIAKDKKWTYDSPYGSLHLCINRSKPELDPRDITRQSKQKDQNYPLCMLCCENEGYFGRPGRPSRSNHRMIELSLAQERWYFQYSPYVYYNEHCIVLKEEHSPMLITCKTFARLLDFVKQFPHYILGSNAGLPIVGGSILTHDHYQGGAFRFPLEMAQVEECFVHPRYDVTVEQMKWPMTCFRLSSESKETLIDAADDFLLRWQEYSDTSVDIYAQSDKVEHNTINPIARFENGRFVLYMILRNNYVTTERPYGLYHPREAYHHIKKENIGLIEVLGLAVLPARLDVELGKLAEHLQKNGLEGLEEDEMLRKHAAFAKELLEQNEGLTDHIEEVLKDGVGQRFAAMLQDAGVFKEDAKGREALRRAKEAIFGSR